MRELRVLKKLDGTWSEYKRRHSRNSAKTMPLNNGLLTRVPRYSPAEFT